MEEIQPGTWVIDTELPFATFIFARLPDREKVTEVVCTLDENKYTKANARAIVKVPQMIEFIKSTITQISEKPNSGRYSGLVLKAYALLNEIEYGPGETPAER